MAVIAGWYALGTGISNTGAFQEATTYTRPAVNLTGTALSGLTQAVSQITGPTGPVGGTLTRGGIFNAVTAGTLLMYWDWVLKTAVPANFLAITVNVVFNDYLKQALNLSLIGGEASSGSSIDAGAQIGTVNGQPLIAATRLQMQGGNLVLMGNSRVIEIGGTDVVFQSNGLNVARLSAAGDLAIKGAITTTVTSP